MKPSEGDDFVGAFSVAKKAAASDGDISPQPSPAKYHSVKMRQSTSDRTAAHSYIESLP